MGEKAGHPFRGNQFSKGGGKSGGGGGSPRTGLEHARQVGDQARHDAAVDRMNRSGEDFSKIDAEIAKVNKAASHNPDFNPLTGKPWPKGTTTYGPVKASKGTRRPSGLEPGKSNEKVIEEAEARIRSRSLGFHSESTLKQFDRDNDDDRRLIAGAKARMEATGQTRVAKSEVRRRLDEVSSAARKAVEIAPAPGGKGHTHQGPNGPFRAGRTVSTMFGPVIEDLDRPGTAYSVGNVRKK